MVPNKIKGKTLKQEERALGSKTLKENEVKYEVYKGVEELGGTLDKKRGSLQFRDFYNQTR